MILLISEIFPPKHGGSGRWFWELYRRMPADTIRIVTHDWPGSQEFDCSHELPIHRSQLRFTHWGILKTRGLKEYVRAARFVRRLVREYRPDVLHCGRCVPEGFLAYLVKKIGGPPYWCYAHGEELVYASESRELAWMARRALKNAETIVANSHTTSQILQTRWHIHPEKIFVLHPGVDTNNFVPAMRNESIRQELGWADRKVVLTVGALSGRKGQDTMIRALPIIRHQVPEILYAIAGEGWERDRLETLAQELGVKDLVQFRGSPADQELINCYQQCDLFALPNRREGNDVEGFGIVLLEAQACGKPVIAGDSGGTSETMQIPATGVVVDCTKPDRLAEMVINWLQNPSQLESMGCAAREWVVKKFDWSILAQQARSLFDSNQLQGIASTK